MKSEFGVLMCILLLTAAAQPSHAEVHQSRPIGEDSEELRSALQNKFGTEYQVFGRPEWQSSSTYLFVIKGEGRDSVLLIDRVKGNLFGLLDVVPQDSKNAKPYIVEEILWLSQNQVVASIDFLEPSMFGYVRRPNLVLLTVKWDEHRYESTFLATSCDPQLLRASRGFGEEISNDFDVTGERVVTVRRGGKTLTHCLAPTTTIPIDEYVDPHLPHHYGTPVCRILPGFNESSLVEYVSGRYGWRIRQISLSDDSFDFSIQGSGESSFAINDANSAIHVRDCTPLTYVDRKGNRCLFCNARWDGAAASDEPENGVLWLSLHDGKKIRFETMSLPTLPSDEVPLCAEGVSDDSRFVSIVSILDRIPSTRMQDSYSRFLWDLSDGTATRVSTFDLKGLDSDDQFIGVENGGITVISELVLYQFTREGRRVIARLNR